MLWLVLGTCLWTAADEARPEWGPAAIQTLPADGTWIEYDVRIEQPDREVRLVWRMQSVGRHEVAGRPHRWIEMSQSGGDEGFPLTKFRLLVDEADFGRGKTPLLKFARGWLIRGTQPVREIRDLESADPPIFILLRGPQDDRQWGPEPERVDWQRGRYEEKPLLGTTTVESGGFKNLVTHRYLYHEDVPFGFLGGKYFIGLIGQPDKPLVKVHMTLRDHGTGATPLLPELQP